MSYIDNNLLPGERIIFRTRKSKILFIWPLILAILSVMVSNYMMHNTILKTVVFAPWVVTGIFWVYSLLEYYTSEYAVTDKRVMMREGFFARHANEMRLTAISQVNVDQNLFGMMLNFGTVSINAFGAFDSYPQISYPFDFQRSVNQQLDLLVK
jgi:uncharacterized membrane protein YdbT with pleckstrin-like domain